MRERSCSRANLGAALGLLLLLAMGVGVLVAPVVVEAERCSGPSEGCGNRWEGSHSISRGNEGEKSCSKLKPGARPLKVVADGGGGGKSHSDPQGYIGDGGVVKTGKGIPLHEYCRSPLVHTYSSFKCPEKKTAPR